MGEFAHYLVKNLCLGCHLSVCTEHEWDSYTNNEVNLHNHVTEAISYNTSLSVPILQDQAATGNSFSLL